MSSGPSNRRVAMMEKCEEVMQLIGKLSNVLPELRQVIEECHKPQSGIAPAAGETVAGPGKPPGPSGGSIEMLFEQSLSMSDITLIRLALMRIARAGLDYVESDGDEERETFPRGGKLSQENMVCVKDLTIRATELEEVFSKVYIRMLKGMIDVRLRESSV